MSIETNVCHAGDTITWLRDLPDYPSPAYTLHYSLSNAASVIKIDALAEAGKHRVMVTAVNSAKWQPGRYDWIAYVANGAGQRYVVDQGVTLIRANPAGTVAVDTRTHARRMLDAIEAALEKRASTDQLDMVRAVFGQRAIERMQGGKSNDPALIVARDKYKDEVAREERAAAIMRGEKSGNRLVTRFSR